jgi:hypothetical protein
MLRPARVLTHGRAIAINEGHELFGRFGEELKLAGVERFAQPLQQKRIGAIGKGRSQAAEEKAERAGGIGEQGETGVGDRRGQLNGTGAQGPYVAQRLGELDGGVGADPLEADPGRNRDR